MVEEYYKFYLSRAPTPIKDKVTDDVESDNNITSKGNEQDTAKCEDRGNQSTSNIKIAYSEEAEPKSQGNIAEKANDKESNPDNAYTSSSPVGHFHQTVIQSKTENKHFVHGDSSRQKGMESYECSSVDQLPQNTGEKVLSISHR